MAHALLFLSHMITPQQASRDELLKKADGAFRKFAILHGAAPALPRYRCVFVRGRMCARV